MSTTQKINVLLNCLVYTFIYSEKITVNEKELDTITKFMQTLKCKSDFVITSPELPWLVKVMFNKRQKLTGDLLRIYLSLSR